MLFLWLRVGTGGGGGGDVFFNDTATTEIYTLSLHDALPIYPVAEEMRLLDVIAQAGGLISPVADKIYVIRKVDSQKEAAVIVASLRKAKHDRRENLRLTPGDIISVERTPITIIFSAFQLINVGAGASIPLFR